MVTFPAFNKIYVLGLIACFTIFTIEAANGKKKSCGAEITASAFDPATASWDIAWPGRVSRYDLVYLSPPIDPMQGIPLGNGDLGVLIWFEDSRIIAVVNKSDLWDDSTFGPFHNWDPGEEDYNTTQRHACRIIIDLKYPVFSTLYLTGFKAKLNLADASLTMEAASPFGKVGLRAFVDHGTGVLLYHLDTGFNEDVPVDISIERYGSRSYSHWYRQINREASIGLAGTEAFADAEGSYLTQKLTTGIFAAGGSVIRHNNLTVRYTREQSHRSAIQLTGSCAKISDMAFYVTSPLSGDPLKEIRYRLSAVRQKGMGSFQKSQEEAWKTLWNRSFMDYGDDYLNNLWYLTLYYAIASQGGKYPGRFNNGLWGWDRDVQNWNFYFHWNQQQLYWPLNAAGFPELIDPYLDFRFRSLPQAQKDARAFFNAGGAFISDVTDRRGYNSVQERDNHTPAAEIALDFWRQYQFTGDKKFLKEKAVPFITNAALFYETRFEIGADGLYHAIEGTGYEGWIKLKDGLTELVYARALFSIALDALKEAELSIPEAGRWKEILEHLAPLPVIKVNDASLVCSDSGFRFMNGYFKGTPAPSGEIMAAGWGIKENNWLTTYSPDTAADHFHMKLLDGIFPSVPSSPVFPSGVIGLKQSGTPMFNNIKTTALLYSPEVTGWDPVPVVLARLGLGDELAKDLESFPGRWQIYCNGWGHWGMEGEVIKDAGWYFRTNKVRAVNDTGTNEFPLPMWPFRHMSMESMSVLATAMNESLLQSYDGVLRIAPAFNGPKTGRFTLFAEGGFVVSSEIVSGRVNWISIRSLQGKPCRLKLPWREATVYSNMKKRKLIQGDIAEIKTSAGEILTITSGESRMGLWDPIPETPAGNEEAKYHPSGKAQLGLPRMF
jgi:alpha-L-fucosidase 2